jgi:hypothetical protein
MFTPLLQRLPPSSRSEQEYYRIFGHDLPPLPPEAFRSGSPLV